MGFCCPRISAPLWPPPLGPSCQDWPQPVRLPSAPWSSGGVLFPAPFRPGGGVGGVTSPVPGARWQVPLGPQV